MISQNTDILTNIRQNTPIIRTAVDFTGKEYEDFNEDVMDEIRGIKNSALSKIAVIPQKYATREKVDYLQKRLITVWILGEDDGSLTDAANLMTMGSFGVISQNRDYYYEFYSLFKYRLSMLRTPYILSLIHILIITL